MTATTTSLATALDALGAVGVRAGLDPGSARAEGVDLAAALAESVPGAPAAWSAVTGGDARAFFDAAVRSRRWRDAPTDLLAGLVAQGSPSSAEYARALVAVTAAACDLGERVERDHADVRAAHEGALAPPRRRPRLPGWTDRARPP